MDKEIKDYLKKEYEEMKRKLKNIGEPTHSFKKGEEVRFGGFYRTVIIDCSEDNKIYLVEATSRQRTYGKVTYSYCYRLVFWVHLRTIKTKPTTLTHNEKFRLDFWNRDVRSLLGEYYEGGGIDMNPFYQRDYVWSLEDKRDLIRSIFNNVQTGSIVVRYRSDKEWAETGYAYEILDGKQRLKTLIDFYEDRFSYEGYYYSDLSKKDRHTFDTHSFGFGQIETKDINETLKVFFILNTKGRIMDKEHLNKIKNMIQDNNENTRICNECGKPITQGYCIHNGEEYYCSDECLFSWYSPKEYDELCQVDEGYWSEWDD